jgi:hypothetical protein
VTSTRRAATVAAIALTTLVADVVSSGKSTKVDVKVDNKTTSSGHIDQDGVAFDYISAGGKLYIKGKALFAKFSQQAADLIGDQWVTASGNAGLEQATAGVSAFSDPSQLADNLTTKGSLTKGDTKTVNGQQVVAIKASDGELDVADSGTPYPIHLEGGALGRIDISEFGAHFGITAPSNALDASTLGQ